MAQRSAGDDRGPTGDHGCKANSRCLSYIAQRDEKRRRAAGYCRMRVPQVHPADQRNADGKGYAEHHCRSAARGAYLVEVSIPNRGH